MPTSDQHRQLRGELTEFLLDAFTSQELGRLLQGLTFYDSLNSSLPPVDTTSPQEFTQRFVDALFRRALHTHRAVYDALIAERPSRGDEILRLAESFGVPDLHPGPLPLPPPLHPSHPPIRVTPTATPPPPPQRAASIRAASSTTSSASASTATTSTPTGRRSAAARPATEARPGHRAVGSPPIAS